MPPVIAVAATMVAGLMGASVFAAAFFMVVVTLAAVAYSAYAMATMEKPSTQSDVAGRLQTIRSSIQPHRMIYGKIMTGGVMVYAQVHSSSGLTDDERLALGFTKDNQGAWVSPR